MLADEQAPRPQLRHDASAPHFAPRRSTTSSCSCRAARRTWTCSTRSRRSPKYAGQRPDSVNLRTERTTGGLFPSPFEFKKHGKSGIEVSELLPNIAADRSTTSASSARCTRSTRRTRRPAACSIPATSPPPGRRWARGSPTAWAPKTRTCPASSCSAPAAAAARRCAAASCRRAIRASASTIRRPTRRR